MKQPCIVSRQSTCIVAVLDVAKRDFLVQFTPLGAHVETESLPGQEGISCSGVSLRDALGQVTQVLALELGIDVDQVVDGAAWTHDDATEPDADAPIGYVPELPVEFCKRFVCLDDPEDQVALKALGCGHVPRPGTCGGCVLTLQGGGPVE